MLHRATQSEQLATICTEKAWQNSLLARRSRWWVRFTKKSTHARGKLRCTLLEGCYTAQRQLQVATIVAKSRTGFYFVQRFAQQNKTRCKLPRYPVTPRNSSATCNETVLRCKLLYKLRSNGALRRSQGESRLAFEKGGALSNVCGRVKKKLLVRLRADNCSESDSRNRSLFSSLKPQGHVMAVAVTATYPGKQYL